MNATVEPRLSESIGSGPKPDKQESGFSNLNFSAENDTLSHKMLILHFTDLYVTQVKKETHLEGFTIFKALLLFTVPNH